MSQSRTSRRRLAAKTPLIKRRQTRQRETILKVLQESRGPLAVPEIHALVEQQLGKVGIATVYRTLNLLQEEQQIAPLIMPTGEMRYEMAGLGHHVHFQCRVCRRVVDLQPSPTTLPRSITAPEHYLVEAFEVILYGLCPHCTP